ncbi:TRAP transporter small permease subunit [Halomonas lysinitropha]|uniref:TRAP transporter small permease protein n=1 Tax=Halomonas lysinitropha TaxID=2607506 RepID=A0A5K1I4L8_9GAMM|nr:TRAP transporter small permease [Halomonas lysinitropha]VVZ95118.1 Tripartite ATP-independent periplasmic transporters, DctQ component [Halomonas lysinitropha]
MSSPSPYLFARRLAHGAAISAGYASLGLSLLITFEVVARKLFNFSLQGVDEIGGYVLAIGVSFSFAYALLHRAHTRVDVLLTHLPRWLQAPLNTLAILMLAAFSVFMLWRAVETLKETLEFGSLASTPLQTPLWIPQGLWVIGLGVFTVLTVLLAGRALKLLATGQLAMLDREYGPRSADDELDEARKDYGSGITAEPGRAES